MTEREVSRRLGGRYQLVREIGKGGMGRVYQAVGTKTGQSVAIKVIRIREDGSADAVRRVQQRVAVLSTLEHPNIVEIYGGFVEELEVCIVMELLQGQSLWRVMHRERLSLGRIRHLAMQVAGALDCAHGRGVVHRDIKPGNIMVLVDDQVKLLDFGIALIGSAAAAHAPTSARRLGTPWYMAPEQIEGQRVDGRADIYSLGAVMYHLVTGRPPFEGEDPLTVAFQHVHRAPQRPRSINPSIPEDWEALILKALAKDLADRFQTAAALADALAALGTRETGAAASAAPPPRSSREPWGPTTEPAGRPDRQPTVAPEPPSTTDLGALVPARLDQTSEAGPSPHQ